MVQVTGIDRASSPSQTIYDPTCGSGSLLIKAADQAPRGVTIYGQEMDNTTAALARMNMILHGNPTAEIWQDNTLSSPYWKNPNGSLKTFDVDASQGFMKDGAKNRLRHQDIRKIVDVFNGQIELPRYSA